MKRLAIAMALAILTVSLSGCWWDRGGWGHGRDDRGGHDRGGYGDRH
jgi:hypothetical protein